MLRRSLLKAFLAAPLGLLFGKKSEAAPVDTPASIDAWLKFCGDKEDLMLHGTSVYIIEWGPNKNLLIDPDGSIRTEAKPLSYEQTRLFSD